MHAGLHHVRRRVAIPSLHCSYIAARPVTDILDYQVVAGLLLGPHCGFAQLWCPREDSASA